MPRVPSLGTHAKRSRRSGSSINRLGKGKGELDNTAPYRIDTANPSHPGRLAPAIPLTSTPGKPPPRHSRSPAPLRHSLRVLQTVYNCEAAQARVTLDFFFTRKRPSPSLRLPISLRPDHSHIALWVHSLRPVPECHAEPRVVGGLPGCSESCCRVRYRVGSHGQLAVNCGLRCVSSPSSHSPETCRLLSYRYEQLARLFP